VGRSVGFAVASPLARFLIRRLIGLAGVLAVLVVGVFCMVQLIPGDPVRSALGVDAQEADVVRIRHENGFDLPFFAQLWRYVSHLAHGDLGRSFTSAEDVSSIITGRIGSSLELAGAALAIVLIGGVTLGMLAAVLTREGRRPRFELGFAGATSILGALPDYLLGTILAFVFAVQFRLLPVAGSGGLKTLILPALAVSLHSTMTLARIVRVETLNVLAQDYIRTARSQRLPARIIYLRYALPNALTAALTVSGLIFASLIGGAVVVENVFARPGLGAALVDAVHSRQYVIVQGITLVLGCAVVLINTVVDLVIALIDPRSLSKQA
jgi:peptide/nickel transport system permease protein